MVAPADQALIKVLDVAELMARVVEGGIAGQLALSAVALDELGLSAEQVQEILGVLTQRAEELASILSLELPSRAELSAAAHARLAETSAQMLEVASEEALLAEMSELKSQLQVAARRQLAQGGPRQIVHAAERPRPTGRESPLAPEKVSPDSAQQLFGEVAAAIARCRCDKRSLSLVLFRVHGMLARGGEPDAYPASQLLLGGLERWSQDRGAGLALAQSTFALLWEGCTRNDGLQLARHVLRMAQDSSQIADGALPSGWVLSAGLATLALPPRNFPPNEIIAAAQRCLAGALLSGGGGTVKSIEF